jgi:hypothetical protein
MVGFALRELTAPLFEASQSLSRQWNGPAGSTLGLAFAHGYRTVWELPAADQAPNGMQPPSVSASGSAPAESAAKLQTIGENRNEKLNVGDAYLILDGGALALDATEFRNVILRNVHIYYYGGPVKMTNVYFVNCTFEMKPGQNSQKLALATLAGGPVDNL